MRGRKKEEIKKTVGKESGSRGENLEQEETQIRCNEMRTESYNLNILTIIELFHSTD